MAAKIRLSVICVGKLRERFWQDAEAEYTKRLSAYTTRLTIAEVTDEPTPDDASPAQEETIRKREAERILGKLGEREYVVALDLAGQQMDSTRFAAYLERATSEGNVSAFTFVIGGSLGLHETVLTRADLRLSFGAFTFPHQLMRVILLEQLYRACKIQRGEPYHK